MQGNKPTTDLITTTDMPLEHSIMCGKIRLRYLDYLSKGYKVKLIESKQLSDDIWSIPMIVETEQA